MVSRHTLAGVELFPVASVDPTTWNGFTWMWNGWFSECAVTLHSSAVFRRIWMGVLYWENVFLLIQKRFVIPDDAKNLSPWRAISDRSSFVANSSSRMLANGWHAT